jgi:hypothetical protein
MTDRLLDPVDNVDLNDWNIGVNYARALLAEYVENISTLLRKKVDVKVLPSEERDGYFGKFRVVKPQAPYIDFFQAAALEDIDPLSLATSSTDDVPARFRLLSSETYGCEAELDI